MRDLLKVYRETNTGAAMNSLMGKTKRFTGGDHRPHSAHAMVFEAAKIFLYMGGLNGRGTMSLARLFSKNPR